ncbi:MFS transporter [Actinocorallia libanotica]|uniref:MFS transporter n=1 Tax=Actinocorallia libanotica TaxID=46162 RepID=A0ABN1RGP2_9ACTN
MTLEAGAGTEPPKERREPAPVSRGFITLYVLALLGTYLAVMTPLLVSLAVHLEQIDEARKETNLGLVIGVGTFVNIVAGPVIGRLSDLTTGRWGRRRPWIVAGMPIMVGGMLVIAGAGNAGMVLAGYAIGQVGISCIMTGLLAMLPDQVPEAQRGKVSGFAGFTAQIAGVIGFQAANALDGSPYLMFGVPALLCCVLVLVAVLVLPDPVPEAASAKARRSGFDLREILLGFVFDPRRHPDMGWTWMGRFLMQFSLMFLSTYQLYFLTDHLDYELDEVTGLLALTGGVGLVMTSGGAVLSGLLSDRLGRRKAFVYAAGTLFAAGFLLVATAPSFLQVFLGSQLILLGAGVFGAVDLAIVTDVIPDRDTQAARYMSIFGIASALPQSAAPVVAPLILALGGGENYPLLFTVAAAIAITAGLTVRPIKGVR